MKDLHILPLIRDSWSYLYVEHCRIEQEAHAIALHDMYGKVPVPCAALVTLMLGPGTSITHAAIRSLAESGCSVMWVGEGGVRFYAQGMGETRRASNLLRQVRLWSSPESRLEVAVQMYRARFKQPVPESLTLRQLRGMEGVRVRDSYARASREAGVQWAGRSYRRDRWDASDVVNRALSCANSCLYGVCHSAIVSAGYSPGLGFIHTGKMLSFVYDIADLYKADIAIPAAFDAAAEGAPGLERRVRQSCREAFFEAGLLPRIVADMDRVLGGGGGQEGISAADFDADAASPGGLWDPEEGEVPGGVNQADDPPGSG